VSLADDALADHFAGWPIFPGTLLVEAMAQLAGAMLDADLDGGVAMLTGIDKARFHRRVVPGDQLALEATVTTRIAAGARVEVAAAVGTERVAEAQLQFAFAHDVPATFVAERAKLRALLQRGTWFL
jgi:3-hydroxyacyl-[acyl-carrier-protein] dehydratase